MLTELAKMPFDKLLSLSILGAIVTTVGSLTALVAKEFFMARSFENWKLRQSYVQVYKRYRDPIFLSAHELCYRLEEICSGKYPPYLRTALLSEDPDRIVENSANDAYFQVYKLRSTLYRLCAFLGWLELYRQHIVFLDSGKNSINRRLESCLEAIRSDFADGQLNNAEDWASWTDGVIFREEQRAIGESMIVGTEGGKAVMGYGRFCEQLMEQDAHKQHRWFRQVVNFVIDLGGGSKDFRVTRLRRLVVHLTDLIQLLEPARVSRQLRERRECYKQDCADM